MDGAASSRADAAAHSYLGPGLRDVAGSRDGTTLRAGQEMAVLLLPLRHVVLFPGETLPLRLRQRSMVDGVRHVLAGTGGVHHIGVAFVKSSGQLSAVGTIVEVRSVFQQGDELVLTSKGRHRFLIRSVTQTAQLQFAATTILPDSAAAKARTRACDNHLPEFVYRACSASRLARTAFDLAQEIISFEDHESQVWLRWGPCAGSSFGSFGCEADPAAFSLFLAANLPAQENALQALLEVNSVVERLLLTVQILRDGSRSRLACAHCGHEVASKAALYNVPGAEGVTGAYVNPHGVVHQTVTVRQLLPHCAIALQGRPCVEDSWFPGYAWTIASCGYCYSHLGWRFTDAGSIGRRAERNTADASSIRIRELIESIGQADVQAWASSVMRELEGAGFIGQAESSDESEDEAPPVQLSDAVTTAAPAGGRSEWASSVVQELEDAGFIGHGPADNDGGPSAQGEPTWTTNVMRQLSDAGLVGSSGADPAADSEGSDVGEEWASSVMQELEDAGFIGHGESSRGGSSGGGGGGGADEESESKWEDMDSDDGSDASGNVQQALAGGDTTVATASSPLPTFWGLRRGALREL